MNTECQAAREYLNTDFVICHDNGSDWVDDTMTPIQSFMSKFDKLYAELDALKLAGAQMDVLAKYAEIDALMEAEAARLGTTL